MEGLGQGLVCEPKENRSHKGESQLAPTTAYWPLLCHGPQPDLRGEKREACLGGVSKPHGQHLHAEGWSSFKHWGTHSSSRCEFPCITQSLTLLSQV